LYLIDLVTCKGDQKIQSVSRRLLDNPGELALMLMAVNRLSKVIFLTIAYM